MKQRTHAYPSLARSNTWINGSGSNTCPETALETLSRSFLITENEMLLFHCLFSVSLNPTIAWIKSVNIYFSYAINQSIQVWGTTEVQWNLLGWSPDTASCKTPKQKVPIDSPFPQKSRHLHDTFVTATLQMQKTTIILQWIQQPAHLFRFSVYMNLVTQTYVYKEKKLTEDSSITSYNKALHVLYDVLFILTQIKGKKLLCRLWLQ